MQEKLDVNNYKDFFMICVANPIEKILIQTANKTINNKDVAFLTIRDVKISDNHKSCGVFTKIIETLESKNIPIMIHDIVNSRLEDFLDNRGYKPHSHYKNNEAVFSMYFA